MEEKAGNTVFVTNIAPTASEKTVADFFAFCGTITSLTMLKKPNSTEGVQEAILEFKQEAAVKTALLLSNAFIVDRPITVTRYTTEEANTATKEAESSQTFDQSQIDNKDHAAPASQRTQTSVIASLLAAGYTLASGSLDAAKKYDEQHKISSSISDTAEAVKAKASEIDKGYKISETASSWTSSTLKSISDLDKRYAISSSATAIVQSTSDAVKETVKPIVENPTVNTTLGTIKTTGDSIISYAENLKENATKYISEQENVRAAAEAIKSTGALVKEEYDSVMEETNRLINEKKREQEETNEEENEKEEKSENDDTIVKIENEEKKDVEIVEQEPKEK